VSSTVASTPAKPTIFILQILGICVFVLAFFLPAVSAGPGNPLKGWECALITLTSIIRAETYHSASFLAAISGLLNPLIVLYLVCSLIPRLRGLVRRLFAGLVLVCMIATWIFFGLAHLSPRIGHILWIVGALLILCGELRHHMPAAAA
jgi:hypothetical protein